MRIVDTKGQLCPAPLIAAKKALKETGVGESFKVITDNNTSFNNLSRFLNDNHAVFTVEEKDGIWTMTVTRQEGKDSKMKAEEYCVPEKPHFEKGDFIIVISSDKMGEGDEELGRLLIGNFIKAIKDLDRLPQKILFYNSGVKLAARTSPHINHLRDLEKMGIEIQLCATCLNHYKLEDSYGAGIPGNMYTIAEIMASAGKIIRP